MIGIVVVGMTDMEHIVVVVDMVVGMAVVENHYPVESYSAVQVERKSQVVGLVLAGIVGAVARRDSPASVVEVCSLVFVAMMGNCPVPQIV